MNETVMQAINLMLIALPTMFVVTLLFIAATRALHKKFPAEENDK